MRANAAFLPILAILTALPLAPAVSQEPPRLQSALVSPALKIENFQLSGEQWTCIADGKPLNGFLLKPAGEGPFPAIILSHGLGGNAQGIAFSKGRELVKWGFICIATDYTHAGKGGTAAGPGRNVASVDFSQAGARPENIGRALACLEILRQQKAVDAHRIGAYGHSMGAFVTIALCAAASDKLAAAAITSGGVKTTAGSTAAAPTVATASEVRVPFLILQGGMDRTVPPESSELFKQILEKSNVPNERQVFEGVGHNVPAERSAEVSRLMREWFTKHHLLLPASSK